MDNYMNTLLEEIGQIVNMDQYEIIKSDLWNPIEDTQIIFYELLLVLKHLDIKMDSIDLELLKYSCVSDERVSFESKICFTCNVRNLINYLIKNGFYKI